METVYHTSETPIVAIDRLRVELRRLVATLDTTMLQIGHRALAAAIGCSASRIPALMQRLEDAGSIIRQPFKNAYLIDVAPLIDQPQAPDRSAPAPSTPTLIDQPPVDLDPPHSNAPDQQDNRDRVKTGCMVDLDSKSQEKESVRSPLFDRLMAQPDMSRGLARKIAKHPIGTLADFQRDLQLAESIAGIHSPFFFTVARWRDGQRVVAPEEPRHEQATRSTTPARARRGPQSHHARRSADPEATVDYAAILAEWHATASG
jgi:hypothetical protein